MQKNRIIHLLPIVGVSIFCLGTVIGYWRLENVSFLNDDFSNLAKGQTEDIFIATVITSVLCILPYLFFIHRKLRNQGKKILFNLSLLSLLFSFPALLGLLYFNTYQETTIHVFFTRVFYLLGGASIVFWSIGLLSISEEQEFKKYWNLPVIESFASIIFIILLLLLNILKNISGPIRQKIGIFGFMVILLFVNFKIFIIEKRQINYEKH